MPSPDGDASERDRAAPCSPGALREREVTGAKDLDGRGIVNLLAQASLRAVIVEVTLQSAMLYCPPQIVSRNMFDNCAEI